MLEASMLVVNRNVSEPKPWRFNGQALGYTRRLLNYFSLHFEQVEFQDKMQA